MSERKPISENFLDKLKSFWEGEPEAGPNKVGIRVIPKIPAFKGDVNMGFFIKPKGIEVATIGELHGTEEEAFGSACRVVRVEQDFEIWEVRYIGTVAYPKPVLNKSQEDAPSPLIKTQPVQPTPQPPEVPAGYGQTNWQKPTAAQPDHQPPAPQAQPYNPPVAPPADAQTYQPQHPAPVAQPTVVQNSGQSPAQPQV